MQNSVFCEEVYPLRQGVRLQFPANCKGWTLIGIHAWNSEKPKNQCSVYNPYSSIRVVTRKCQISKGSSLIRLFNTLNTQLLLDDESFCEIDETNSCTEKSEAVILTPHSYTIPYFNLIDFFLAIGGKWDYKIPSNYGNIIVESEYNFDFLIPDVKVIKEIIEEYCTKMKLIKKECFTYKLGEALIRASKDWHKGGYLRFFFYEVPRLKRELRKKQK